MIQDELFIDLIYKYTRVWYGENSDETRPMVTGLVQGESLSPILLACK